MSKDPFESLRRHHNLMKKITDHDRLMQNLMESSPTSLIASQSLIHNPNWTYIADVFESSAMKSLIGHQMVIEQVSSTQHLWEQISATQQLYDRFAPMNNVVMNLAGMHSSSMINTVPSNIFSNLEDVVSKLDDVFPVKHNDDIQTTIDVRKNKKTFIKKINWIQFIQIIFAIWAAYASHVSHQEQMTEFKKQTKLQEKSIMIQEQQLNIEKQRLQVEMDSLKTQVQFEEEFMSFVESVIPLIPTDQDDLESNPSSDSKIE